MRIERFSTFSFQEIEKAEIFVEIFVIPLLHDKTIENKNMINSCLLCCYQ
jgi:hypothetical protein